MNSKSWIKLKCRERKVHLPGNFEKENVREDWPAEHFSPSFFFVLVILWMVCSRASGILLIFCAPSCMFLFVCCLRLQKLWRNSAFPFLCFNLPLSSPEFFYCSSGFLLCFFFCMLCLNSGTKPKLGLALCFLPFVFVFFPFLCFVRSPGFFVFSPPQFFVLGRPPSLCFLALVLSVSCVFFFSSSPRFCSFFPFQSSLWPFVLGLL